MSGHIREDPEISQIWTVNQVNQHDWPKATGKKYPIKLIQTITRAQLRDSPFKSARVALHMYCTLFLLINTLLALFLSVFVGIPFCKAEGPGPLSLATDLVARNWCFHHRNPAQSLAGNPAPSHCRPRPPEIGVATSGGSLSRHITHKSFPGASFSQRAQGRKGAAC